MQPSGFGKRAGKRFWAASAVVLAIAAGSQISVAAPVGYALDLSDNLYMVDFGTGAATLVAATNFSNTFEALAIAPDGRLFATSGAGVLYTIDPANGNITPIGDPGLGPIEGLDFNGNTLTAVTYTNTPSFYALSTVDGVATLLATSNTVTGVPRGMTIKDANTAIAHIDGFAIGDDKLASFDLTTGVATVLGAIDPTPYGLDFANDGTLYGLSIDGQVLTVDPATGAATLIADTGDQWWLALAFPSATAAVPEPGTAAIFALGLAGLGWARRKKGR